MKIDVLVAAVLALVGAFFEYAQHSDHRKKHPDAPCPSGVLGFVILAVFLIIIAVR